jgi:molecular chaperone GrpE (heat shock protein)
MTPPTSARKPPKPRIPARTKGAHKESSKAKANSKQAAGRVTTAELASRLERVAGSVERMERLLSPSHDSTDVAAEEQALLNLVDSIVERRTEHALVPLARLATLVERLATVGDDERTYLAQETLEQLSLVLEGLGIDKVSPPRGSELNPLLHQEVEERPDTELEEGLIASVVRPGFRVRGGRLLIPALVAVSCGRQG